MAPMDIKTGYPGPPQYQPFMLQSPVNIVPPRSVSQPWVSSTSPMMSSQPEVHNITLSTPPQRFERTDTMQNLGLGIANVNFTDRSQAITPVEKDAPVFPSPLLVSEDDEYDEAGEDDSDDEFIPSGRGRPRKKVGGKKKKGRGVGETT